MNPGVAQVAKTKAAATSVELYRENRKAISPKELAKHQGKWVAFSRDGSRIIASAKKLETLDRRVVAAGGDPQAVVLEYVGAEEIALGGAEFL